jgi:hypothetical protein
MIVIQGAPTIQLAAALCPADVNSSKTAIKSAASNTTTIAILPYSFIFFIPVNYHLKKGMRRADQGKWTDKVLR